MSANRPQNPTGFSRGSTSVWHLEREGLIERIGRGRIYYYYLNINHPSVKILLVAEKLKKEM